MFASQLKDSEHCKNLWRAVLGTAFYDIRTVDPFAKGGTESHHWSVLRAFFDPGNPHFVRVCEWTDHDPLVVAEKALKIMAERVHERKAVAI